MATCVSILRTERWASGWVEAMTEDDIRRVLARYKEHVTFWNIRYDMIQRELVNFSEALGRNYNSILATYEFLPPRRELPEYEWQR